MKLTGAIPGGIIPGGSGGGGPPIIILFGTGAIPGGGSIPCVGRFII